MLALPDLSKRDVTPMIHVPFHTLQSNLGAHIVHSNIGIQPLALGCPDGAMFHTLVTATIIVLGRNCGNAGTGPYSTIPGPLAPVETLSHQPLRIQ
jgi:hypothetical protein